MGIVFYTINFDLKNEWPRYICTVKWAFVDVCNFDTQSTKLTVVCSGQVTRWPGCGRMKPVHMQPDSSKIHWVYILEFIKIGDGYKIKWENTTRKSIGRLVQYTFQFSFDITKLSVSGTAYTIYIVYTFIRISRGLIVIPGITSWSVQRAQDNILWKW